MTLTIQNWKSQEIKSAKSRGGKLAVLDYRDNLIIPKKTIWPHPDILKKLYKSNRISAFHELDQKKLKEKLGFYCDLQSLRSEDAITWSIFGTLQLFDEEKRVEFLNSLFTLLELDLKASQCTIQCFMRIAHPDTLVSGGPELDFFILTDSAIILGESKWRSKIGEGQGKSGRKNQLQLRSEYLEKYGKKIFTSQKTQLVLLTGITSYETNYNNIKSITWEEVCKATNHPLKEEISKYYSWKKQFD